MQTGSDRRALGGETAQPVSTTVQPLRNGPLRAGRCQPRLAASKSIHFSGFSAGAPPWQPGVRFGDAE